MTPLARSGAPRDAGSAGLETLWAVAVVFAATLVGLTWAGAVSARQRAESAADLAALAGAQVVSRHGDACLAAATVATASAARLTHCVPEEDGSVRVVVEVRWAARWATTFGMPPARARARAGATGVLSTCRNRPEETTGGGYLTRCDPVLSWEA